MTFAASTPPRASSAGSGRADRDQGTTLGGRGKLCEFAQLATVTQLRRVLRSYDFPPDPPTMSTISQPAVAQPVELLSLWHSTTDAGTSGGGSDADHGAILNAALREAQDALFHRDGVVVSNVEALVEIANRSLDAVCDPARRDRYRVHVHLDVDNTMIDGLGYRLPGWLRDLICCDTIVSTVNEAAGIPVSVGRTQRTVPERTRRLVILRDRSGRPCAGLHRGSVLACPSRHPLGPRVDGAGPTDT